MEQTQDVAIIDALIAPQEVYKESRKYISNHHIKTEL